VGGFEPSTRSLAIEHQNCGQPIILCLSDFSPPSRQEGMSANFITLQYREKICNQTMFIKNYLFFSPQTSQYNMMNTIKIAVPINEIPTRV